MYSLKKVSFPNTRFLSLMLVIEQILHMFIPLEEYFGLVAYSLKDLFVNLLGEI